MKNNILSFFIILLFVVACKKESKINGEAVSKDFYLNDVAGFDHNGAFVVNNPDTIKKYWGNKLRSERIEGKLKDIEIISVKPDGKSPLLYLLVVKSEDKKVKAAAFVNLKDGKFYFEKENGALNLSICRGCIENCNPMVIIHEGIKSIVCSSCADCLRGDAVIY